MFAVVSLASPTDLNTRLCCVSVLLLQGCRYVAFVYRVTHVFNKIQSL